MRFYSCLVLNEAWAIPVRIELQLALWQYCCYSCPHLQRHFIRASSDPECKYRTSHAAAAVLPSPCCGRPSVTGWLYQLPPPHAGRLHGALICATPCTRLLAPSSCGATATAAAFYRPQPLAPLLAIRDPPRGSVRPAPARAVGLARLHLSERALITAPPAAGRCRPQTACRCRHPAAGGGGGAMQGPRVSHCWGGVKSWVLGAA